MADWQEIAEPTVPASGPQAVMDNPTAEPPVVEEPAAEPAVEPQQEPETPQKFEDMSEPELRRALAGTIKDLQQERSSRRELQQFKVEQAERDRVLQDRLEIINNAIQQKEQESQVAQAPDPETDPVGNLSWRQDQFAKAQQQQLTAIQQQLQMQTQANTGQAELDYISQQEAAFLQKGEVASEQYESALEHVRGAMRTYYSARGVPEQYMEAAIAEEERGFARSAIQMGNNPAESRVEFARSLGWSPPAEPHVPGEVPQATEPAKTLEFKKGGVEASKSLSEASGASGKRRITLQDLYEAPPELFDKIRKNQGAWDEINIKGEILI
jgi:hypothetical protein